jgi:hypothetical protein
MAEMAAATVPTTAATTVTIAMTEQLKTCSVAMAETMGNKGTRNNEGYKELKMRNCGPWALEELQRVAEISDTLDQGV